MKFYNMGNKGLAYPVKCNNKVVIPEGAKHVKIAFRQSPFTYIDPETGRREHLNVYIYENKMYHA